MAKVLLRKPRQLLSFIKKNPKATLKGSLITATTIFLLTVLFKLAIYISTVVFARPQIIWSYPISGDKEFPLDSKISISFSKEMNKQRVEQAFNIYNIFPQENNLKKPVEGTISWEDNNLIFTPNKPFERDQTVIISIDKTASAANLRHLAKTEFIEFTTLSNPHIAMASPTGSITEEVKNIVIMFNKSMHKPEEAILEVVPKIQGEAKWVGSSAYMIKPENLKKGEKYTVKLVQDLNSIDGGTLSKGYEFEFVNFAPAILNIQPTSVSNVQNSGVNPNGPITIYFNQRVDRQSVFERLSLSQLNNKSQIGYTVKFIDRPNEDKQHYYYREWESKWVQKAEVYPSVVLQPKGTYTLSLEAGFKSEEGGATAEFGQNVSFVTADLPGYISANIANGAVNVDEQKNLKLDFKSPMNSEEIEKTAVIKKNGVITDDDYFIYANSYDNSVSFGRYLDRSTFYEITIPANTKDAYGRSLGQDVHISFTTAPYKSSISIHPNKDPFVTFADNVNTRFITRVVNTPVLIYNLYSMSADSFMDLYETNTSIWKRFTQEDLTSSGFKLVKSLTKDVALESNVITDVLFDINRDMGIDLPSGFYYLDIRFPNLQNNSAQDSIAFVIGDIAITQKFTNDKTLIWATSLSQRATKEQYSVNTYKLLRPNYNSTANKVLQSAQQIKTPRTPILSGRTDHDGIMTAEFSRMRDYSIVYLTILDKDGDVGIVFDSWDEGISTYDFGNVLSSGYYNSTDSQKYKGFAVTDRQLYRPGQKLYYTAFIRNNGYYKFSKVEADSTVQVTITDQQSYYNSGTNTLYTQNFKTTEQDMYSGEFVLPLGLKLGRYILKVTHAVGNTQSTVYQTTFDVQEYVRPEFEVVPKVPNAPVIRGDELTLSAEARYFYGAPLVNSESQYKLYKRNYIFTEDKFSDFTFYSRRKYYGDDYYYWKGFEEEEVTSGETRTNNNGKIAFNPSTLTQDGVTEIYTFEADALGESDKRYTGTGEYIVHMAEHYTGLKTESYLGKAGDRSTVEILTINTEGDELEDIDVKVSVYLRKYFRAKKKDNSEGYLYETTYEDSLVTTDKVTTNNRGKAIFDFVPENAGTHIIEVESFDKHGNRSISDIFYYVSSSASGYWRQENHDRIDLITDKGEYQPGDDASIAPISTLEKAIGLLTIEAEDVIEYDVFRQDSSSEVQKFKVKDEHIPNVYVSMLLVSPGESVYKPAEFKIGIVNINVDASKNELKLELSTNKESYSPKEEGEATIKVKDKSGNPVKDAKLTVALVDDALMSIASLKRVNAFSYFYSPRYHAIQTVQSLTQSLDRININTEIGAKGGSGSKGGAGGDYLDLTRSNFAETALWLSEVKTDGSGEAKVKFTLPDSITRWNLFALSQDESGAKFGQEVYKFGSLRDIFGLPAVPRFIRVGDIAKVGLVVHNNTSESKKLGIGIQAQGLTIKDEYYKNVTVEKNSSRKVYFNTEAQDVEKAELTFSVTDADAVKDVVVSSFDVLPYGLEMVQSFSNAVKYLAIEEFELNPKTNKNYGGLVVDVYGSMLGIADSSIKKLDNWDYLSVRDISSKTVPLIYKYKLDNFQNNTDSAKQVELKILNNISLLTSAQKVDGGWGYWTQALTSNVYDTALALEVLSEAKKAGLSANNDAILKGVKYIETELTKSDYTKEVSPYILYSLELSGSDQTGRISNEYEQKAVYTDIEKAYLIMAMHQNRGDWSTHIKQLASELALKADLGSGRMFWSSSRSGRICYFCNDFMSTASVLRAFNLIDADGPVANLAIRHLAQLKESGYKYVTLPERGKATAILENILQRNIKTRDTKVEILVNDVVKASGEVYGKNPYSSVTGNIAVNELIDGTNKLEIKLDKGGNAFYSAVLTTLMPFDIVEETSNEIGLAREFYDYNGNKITNNTFKLGESYIVRLTVATPNIRRNVILEDFLPAGFESINDTLENESAQSVRVASEVGKNEDDNSALNNRWYLIDSQQMKDSSTLLQMSYIPTGLYEYSYVVRATVPGEYKYRPAHIFEENSPDIRANTEGMYVYVEE